MDTNSKLRFKMITISIILLFLVINAVPVATSKGLANTPWPSHRRDARNTGQTNIDISSIEKKLKWTYETGGQLHSSPVIGYDGTIYIGSTDHFLHAVKSDGSEKWIYETRFKIKSSMAIDENGTIYFGSTDNNFYAVQPNGEQKWHLTTMNSVFSSPTIGDNGLIYFTSSDGKLYALNEKGEKIWKCGLGGFRETRASPAYGPNNTVYTGYGNTLYAVKDGNKMWRFNTGEKIETAPAISNDGHIYVASDKLYCLDQNGEQLWNFSSNNSLSTSPAIGPNGNLYVGSMDDNLYSLTSDGVLRWKFGSNSYISSSPVIGKKGTVIFGSEALYSLYPNGSLKWKFKTDSKITSSPAIGGDGTIYFGCEDGKLYAIGKSTSYPSPPRNLNAEVQNGYVNISWDASSYTGSSPIQYYEIFRKTGQSTENLVGTINSTETFFIDKTVKKGNEYTYYAKAKNSQGSSETSKKVSIDLTQSNNQNGKDMILYLLLAGFIIFATGIVMTLKRKKQQKNRGPLELDSQEGTEEDGFYNKKTYTCPHCGYSSSLDEEEIKPETCPRCNSKI